MNQLKGHFEIENNFHVPIPKLSKTHRFLEFIFLFWLSCISFEKSYRFQMFYHIKRNLKLLWVKVLILCASYMKLYNRLCLCFFF